MIQANELRIGNIINYLCEDNLDERKEWYAPAVIDWQDLKYLSEREERNKGFIPDKKVKPDYKPIELTEEILLKCGFVSQANRTETILRLNSFTWYSSSSKDICYEYFEKEIHIDCEHLHQLQNIVHALTNEELKINL